MQHHQTVVEGGSHAVAGEVLDHVVAESLGIGLDNAADHVDFPTRLHGLDAAPHGLLRAFHQQAVFLGDVTGEEGGVGVAVDAILESGDVDVDDVTIFDHGGVRDAVANNLIEAHAAGFRKVPVAQRGRVSAVVQHVLVSHAIDLVGGHTGGDGRAGLAQRFGSDAACLAHLLNGFGILDPRFADVLSYRVFPRVLGACNLLRNTANRGWLSGGQRCSCHSPR